MEISISLKQLAFFIEVATITARDAVSKAFTALIFRFFMFDIIVICFVLTCYLELNYCLLEIAVTTRFLLQVHKGREKI